MTPAEFVTTEALTFSPGQLVIVSGPDSAAIMTLLLDARDSIRGASIPCLDPIDTRMTIPYPSGLVASEPVPTTSRFKAPLFRNSFFEVVGTTIKMLNGAAIGEQSIIAEYNPETNIVTLADPFSVPPAVGDEFSILPIVEKPYKFEQLALVNRAAGPTPNVVLIGNEFDRESHVQNPFPVAIDIDTVIDLLNMRNMIKDHPQAGSTFWGGDVRELFAYISKVYYYDTRAAEITFVKNQLPERP